MLLEAVVSRRSHSIRRDKLSLSSQTNILRKERVARINAHDDDVNAVAFADSGSQVTGEHNRRQTHRKMEGRMMITQIMITPDKDSAIDGE